MAKYGNGLKIVLVKSYVRWRFGKREHVEEYSRGAWHPIRFRPSPYQLDFGFNAQE